MKTKILILLSIFTVSCASYKEEIKQSCNCDYVEITVNGEQWIAHKKSSCYPHNKKLEDSNWVLIH